MNAFVFDGIAKNNIKQPLVSVVIVAYNGLKLTRECLYSVTQQTYENLELIFVDNGAEESLGIMVTKEFPQIKMLSLKNNIGFAGGHNKGILASTGKYVAIINNDAVAAPDWIEMMVKAAEADDHSGSVASMILDGQNPHLLDSFGVGVAFDGMSRQVNHLQPPPDIKKPQEILLASGCACMFRMSALRETGLFDEAFFAYCEDTDLGLRLRWAGYKCIIVPEAKVLHHYSMTTGKFSIKKIFWVERNHYWVVFKNFPTLLLLLLPVFTCWRFILQAVILFKGTSGLIEFVENTTPTKLIGVIIKANIAALCGIPAMFKARYRYPRCVSQIEMIKILMRNRLSIYSVLTGTD